MMPAKSWTASLLGKVTNAVNQAKYTNEGKELVLQMALIDHDTGKQKTMSAVSTQDRQLLVCSYRIKDQPGIHVFNSADEKSQNTEIWRVCDASSAAPVYFSAVVVNEQEYVDGGMALNNPSLVALNAAKARSKIGNRPVHVLSMGTGGTPADMGDDVGAAEALADGLTNFVTDPYTQAYLAAQYCEAQNWSYLRIDGDLTGASSDMDNVTPDNLKRLEAAGHSWATSKEQELRAFLRKIIESENQVVIHS